MARFFRISKCRGSPASCWKTITILLLPKELVCTGIWNVGTSSLAVWIIICWEGETHEISLSQVRFLIPHKGPLAIWKLQTSAVHTYIVFQQSCPQSIEAINSIKIAEISTKSQRALCSQGDPASSTSHMRKFFHTRQTASKVADYSRWWESHSMKNAQCCNWKYTTNKKEKQNEEEKAGFVTQAWRSLSAPIL